MDIWDVPMKDDAVQENDFPVLPEGTYEFQVESASGRQYQPKPGSKIGVCAEIDVRLRVEGKGQDVRVFDRLYADPRTIWKMTAFAKCIGVFTPGMTPGDLMRKAEGQIGTAHIILRPATSEYPARNEVKAYIAKQTELPDAEELPF